MLNLLRACLRLLSLQGQGPTLVAPRLYHARHLRRLPEGVRCVLDLSHGADAWVLRLRCLRYQWEPTPDAVNYPGHWWLSRQAGWVQTCLDAGESVLIHDGSDSSARALAVLAAVLMEQGCSLQETLQQLAPAGRPGSVFVSGLRDYDDYLRHARFVAAR